jgi:aspartate aminotransferase
MSPPTELALSARVDRIRTSASLAAGARSRALIAEGRDIVDLTMGEPDFDTPAHIVDAAVAAMRRGETRYTSVNGTPALRAAIAASFEARYATTYAEDEITVGSGAKQLIFLALMATLDEGAEVVIPAPYWVSYPDMVLANDGHPVVVECPEADGFRLTAAALERAITPRTRWLILNAPGNPTGAIYPAAELHALAQVLLRHPQVLVLTDDIYGDIVFGDVPVVHLLEVEPRLRDRVLMVNGVSKSYAMTGWRLGFAAGPRRLVGAVNKLISQMTSCPSSISQAAAVAALTGDQSFVRESVVTYRQRRDRAVALLAAVPGLTCSAPDGAFYLFVGCRGMMGRTAPDGRTIATDEDMALYLLDSAGVATVHGGAYGLSPYVRLSFAVATATIEDACARIARACADLV